MRLTLLYICGTLLAFASLSWTAADSGEGDLLGDKRSGPCAVTLRPVAPCRQGQDENTCPYLFSLPPLTVHLPKQLRELEKIMKDLQKLKDNVDQLRKMCADCTVSQSERACGRQKEREREKLNEGMDRHGDEKNWMNERNPERLKDFRQECGTDRVKMDIKVEETMEGDGDTYTKNRTILEEKEIKKSEAERESDKGVIIENERVDPLKEVAVAEKYGKTQTEWTKGKDKLGQAKVPIASGKETIVDMAREKIVEKNRESDRDRNKEKDRKGFPKGEREDMLEGGKERKTTTNIKNSEKTPESDHHVRQDKTKETEKKTQNEEDRDSDGIKMSEEHDKHTNKEQEQHREERKKEMEKGIKAEQDNEKPKQIESIGHAEKEKTITEGEVDEEDRETGKEIKTEVEKTVQSVQRDSDGELASTKVTERTDFVSISPTPQSTSLAPKYDSMDSNEATTFMSSLPSPPLSSSTSHSIIDVNQRKTITDYELSTQNTGKADTSEHLSPFAEAGVRTTSRPTTDTTNTLDGPGEQITTATARLTTTTSRRPGAGFQGRAPGSSTTTTTTPSHNLYTTTFPGVTDRSRWTAKKNISSNTKTGIKPLPGQRPTPGEKHKPGIKPKEDKKPKSPKNDRKPDRASLPDKKTKHDQKQKPFQQKIPTNQTPKPGKDTKHVQIFKPDQRGSPDNLTTDQNMKNNQIPKHDRAPTTDESKLPNQKPNLDQKSMSHVQRPTSQRPATLNTTDSDKETSKPDQKQKPEKKKKSEEESKPNQRSELNQHFTPVPEPESENLAPKSNQKPVTELIESYDETSSSPEPKTKQDPTPGQKLTPDRGIVPSDQRPKSSQKIPKINQKPKPGYIHKVNQSHPVLVTDQKTKPNVKPKPGQAPQTNQGLKTPLPDQMPNLNSKSVPDEIPEGESNKTAKTRPHPRHRPPTRPVLNPGATAVQTPKPAVQPKPSPKTKTDLDLPHISVTTSNGIQNSQTDMPPTSGPVKQIADVTHSPGDTEFSPSTKKIVALDPQTYNSLETGSFPHLHTLPKGLTVSPNSRITSDLRPQTVGQPSSIPVTTRPNNIIHGILPSFIPGTSPGSSKPNLASNTDSSSQAMIFHNVEEPAPSQSPEADKIMIPVPTASDQTTSTVSPDFRSTTPAKSGPEPLDTEFSTPSARELRVKINQVAALLNNSLTQNERPPDRRPKEHPKDNQGGSRPDRTDSKLPTLTSSQVAMPRGDCSDHLLRGETKSGVYLVTPDIRSKSFPVFCDMELGGGGWTLIQRRQDGSVNFNRTWAEYGSGFGQLDGGEFWLGNNMIHLLTRDRDMVLRVELEDFDGVVGYAQYEQFRVASERLRYRLTVGGYSGTAGDALRFSRTYDHNNRAFTTPDRDHDRYPSGNCGTYYSSGWWFDACMAANLNGRYHVEKYKGIRDGIFWGTWHNISKEYYPTSDRRSFKAARMMIRPKGFAP